MEGTEAEPVRWGMGDAVLAAVLAIVVSGVVVGVAFAVFGVTAEESDDLALWAQGLLQLPLWSGLLGVPVWASWRKGRRSLRADFGLRMVPRDIPVGLAVGFAGQLVLGIVLLPIYDLVGLDRDKVGETARELTDRATGPADVIILILMVVVGAAVVEEICWRGLWLRAIERRAGTLVAVVGSSLAFGSIHFQLYDLPALAGFGLITAVLTVRSGRLGPAIFAHMAFNATAVANLLLTT